MRVNNLNFGSLYVSKDAAERLSGYTIEKASKVAAKSPDDFEISSIYGRSDFGDAANGKYFRIIKYDGETGKPVASDVYNFSNGGGVYKRTLSDVISGLK